MGVENDEREVGGGGDCEQSVTRVEFALLCEPLEADDDRRQLRDDRDDNREFVVSQESEEREEGDDE